MNIEPEIPLNNLLTKVLPFLLSFLDDALLLGLSRLGLHLHWLHWLSPVVLSCTLVYWAVGIGKSLYHRSKI